MSEKIEKEERKPYTTGRPTKYESWMLDKALEILERGESLAAVAAELDVHQDTINEWRKEHPEFSATLKIGLQKAQKWWEDKYMQHMIENPGCAKLNTTGFIFMMKSRFRDTYAEQQQILAVKVDDTKIPDDIRDKLDSLEAKIRDSGKR